MAQTAGLQYGGTDPTILGACLTNARDACVNAGNGFGTYGCFNTGNKRDPYPCMIGEAEDPDGVIDIPQLDALTNPAGAEYILYGALMAFSAGFAVGHAIKYLSKFK